jgi:hypothetical protein
MECNLIKEELSGMSKQKKEKPIKLSYESDGKMGQNLKENQSNDKQAEFFNITPASE